MTPHGRSRVVVIGAGPAGLHMAACLRRRGYRHVRVLEAQHHLGGLGLSVSPAEVLAALQRPAEGEHEPLAERIAGSTREVGVGRRELLGDFETGEFRRIDRWLRGVGAAAPATEPTLVERAHVLDAAIRYQRLYFQLLGPRENAFVVEPHEARLQWVDGSMLELLMQHRLQALVPLLTITQALAGRGPLAQVPAYYGLLANRPAQIWRWLRGSADAWPVTAWPGRDPGQWSALVRMLELDVQPGVRVIGVSRPRTGPHRLQLTSTEGWSTTIESDVTIVSVPLPQFVSLLHRPTVAEVELSGQMHSARLRVTQIASPDRPFREHPWAGLVARLGGAMKGEIHALRRAATRGAPPLDEWVVSQFDRSDRPDAERLDRALAEGLRGLGFARHEVLEQSDHRCHCQFTAAGIRQRGPWRLQEQQGVLGTFYVGSSASFGEIGAIDRHNRRLCERWFRPVVGSSRRVSGAHSVSRGGSRPEAGSESA